MKKIVIFLIIGIFIFSFGCATLKPERNVVDNVFYSSFPKIKIKIDEDFKYLGDVSKEGNVEGIEITLHRNETYYPFIVAEKNYVKKAFIIRIAKTSGKFILKHPKNIEKKAIDYGSTKIGDNKYLYYIRGASPTLRGYLVKHIYDKGYIMSCGILSRYRRIAGADNYLEAIMYYEKIPDDSALNCGTWKNKIYITENHLSYIEEYKKRFESSFEIAGPKTTFEAARLKTTSENVWPAFAAYDTTNKTFIEIKEPDQVREFGEPKYDVSPGDILEVIQTKTCRSGSGICWKVRNVKTGELGYVFAERMRKRHRVYKGDSNFEIAGPKTTSETVSPKTTSDSQLAGDGPQKLAYNVNLEEPWTGKWRVEGHSTFKGIWAMKQSGQIVKSTKDSYFKFEGIVRGNQLEGKLIGDANLTHNFIITLSSDGQSFKGITKGQHAPSSGPIKGKRE